MKRNSGSLYNNSIPFDIFPATGSNQITYSYFCLAGGLENNRLKKVMKSNGSHVYFTYHKIDTK